MKNITLAKLDNKEQITELQNAFSSQGIQRVDGYFQNCYEENISGLRVTIIAYVDHKVAGCCHLLMKSTYEYFSKNNIPEINDLNVFPQYRKQGIAGSIIDELERYAGESYESVGIGVGLFKDYGAAQRLYCKKGYIPDGNGIQYNNMEVKAGTYAFVDDDLNLYFTKKLK